MKVTNRIRYARPFLIVCAVTLIAVSIFSAAFAYVYHQSVSEYRNQLLEKTKAFAQQSADSIGERFRMNVELISSYQDQNDFVYLGSLKKGLSTPYDFASFKKFQSVLNNYFHHDSLFYEMGVYFDADTSFVCTSSFSSHDFQSDCQNELFSYQDQTADQFATLVKQNANNAYTFAFTPSALLEYQYLPGRSEETFFYVRKPPAISRESSGYTLLFISTTALKNSMFYITSEDNRIRLFSGNNVVFDEIPEFPELDFNDRVAYHKPTGNTYFLIPISNMGLTACIAVSDSVLYQPVLQLTRALRLQLVVVLLLTGALFLLVCLHWVRPLQRLSSVLPQTAESGPAAGIKQFETEWTRLSRDHHKIQMQVDALQPLVQASLMMRLLQGQYLSSAEQDILHSIPEAERNRPYLCAVIGSISSLRYLQDSNASAVKQTVQQQFPCAHIHILVAGQYTLVLSADEANLRDRMRQLLEALQRLDPQAEYAIGVGSVVRGLSNVSLSYNEALHSLNEAVMWRNAGICYYQSNDYSHYHYQIAYQELDKLYNLISSGNGDAACDLIDHLAETLHGSGEEGQRNILLPAQFFYDLSGVFIRLGQSIDLGKTLSSITIERDASSFAENIALFKKAALYAAELINNKHENSANELAQELQCYLYEHYADPSLSLSAIAEHFSMSETGMSRFFKMNVGMNLSVFLEKLRISEAETLLLETAIPVRDVAQRVGYLNAATFYKAFKRKHGIPPGDWAKAIKQRKD